MFKQNKLIQITVVNSWILFTWDYVAMGFRVTCIIYESLD